jgi:uncharacterized protein YndB with AHSA1/START domain
MEKTLIATAEITINAPVSKVWDALINPKMIKQYLHGTDAVSDWKVGSPIYFRGTWKDKAYEDKGKILQIKMEKLLQYTYWSSLSGLPDVPESYYTLSFEISSTNSRTLLKISRDNVTDEQGQLEFPESWAAVLVTLKALLEK